LNPEFACQIQWNDALSEQKSLPLLRETSSADPARVTIRQTE
jgi:hypothetical protein